MATPTPDKMTWRVMAEMSASYFERMRVARELSLKLDELMAERHGLIQHLVIEQQQRAQAGTLDNDDVEGLIDFSLSTQEMQSMTRMCQIILWCSSFESFCRNAISDETDWTLDPHLIRDAKDFAQKNRQSFLVTLLEKAEARGMQSSAWPRFRDHVKTLLIIRNHFVHQGLDGSANLREKLSNCIASIPEIGGNTLNEKLDQIAPIGQCIRVPQAFLDRMLEILEQLAAELMVPVDTELPPQPSLQEIVAMFEQTFGSGVNGKE